MSSLQIVGAWGECNARHLCYVRNIIDVLCGDNRPKIEVDIIRHMVAMLIMDLKNIFNQEVLLKHSCYLVDRCACSKCNQLEQQKTANISHTLYWVWSNIS